MVEKVDVHILYCGQGMTNWIEYYADETDTEPTMMGIVDLGGKGLESDRAPNFIADRLKSFDEDNREIRFVVISHQDNDHWLLITPFIAAIKDEGVTIKKIWQGGQGWGQQGKAAVQKLVDATDSKSVYLPNYCSDYNGNDTAIASEGSCNVRVIIANAPCTDRGSGMMANGTSAMIAIELGGNSVVLPGDATYETMDYADAIYQRSDGPKPCFGLSLPHHGSLRTSVTGYARRAEVADMDFSYVQTFREHLKAKHLVASSGPTNGHKHPIYEILKEFETYCVAADPTHYIQAFLFEEYEWYIYTRATPVWTTIAYNKVDPPPTKKRKATPAEPTYTLYFKNVTYTLKSTGVTAVRETILNPQGTPMPTVPTVASGPTEDESAAHAARVDVDAAC